jgi:hypothetical protein
VNHKLSTSYGFKMMKNLVKTVLFGFPITICGALILRLYWGWFIVEYLHFAALSFKQALGVTLTLGWLLSGPTLAASAANKDANIDYMIFMMITYYIYVLVIGFTWHLLMMTF